MKKCKLVLAALVVCLTVLSAWAGQWTYNSGSATLSHDTSGWILAASRNGTNLTVTGVSVMPGTPSALPLSDPMPGYALVSIGFRAFDGCTGLTAITIPAGVTSIGFWAFDGCTGLTAINVHPGNAAYASTNGILYNKNQTALIQCPGGLTAITIPAGVISIGDWAFYDCTGLTAITIPAGVTSIGSSAFFGCSALASVTLPGSVTEIGEAAFNYCSALAAVTIPDGIANIGYGTFWGCYALTSVTIPDSVTFIGNYAFYRCSSLTSVIIGNSVTNTGYSAFSGCSINDLSICATNWPSFSASEVFPSSYRGLTNLVIGVDVTVIGSYAFSGCTNLTGVTIGNSVTSIGDFAFFNCALTSVTIPASVTIIGRDAFAECTGLTGVTIGNSVSSIGGGAFADCTSLASVTIPDSVTNISADAFAYCTSLTNIVIGSSVTSIGNRAFSECKSLTSVAIPASVTSIGDGAFAGCTRLTGILIPAGVTSIGYDAFGYCTNLTGVTIPDSVISIGNFAFYRCTALASVTIGNSVTNIGGSAFSGCASLTSVAIPDSVTYIGVTAFRSCTALASVTIGNSVTSIGSDAFRDCTSLTSVTIPDSVISVGNQAFCSCTSLNSVTIGNSVTNIGDGAFRDCYSLTSVINGNNVTSIGDLAFYYCTSLTSVTIPDSVISVGNQAFCSCTSLNSVTIGNSVTNIGNHAFGACASLTSVKIPDSVTSIGDLAFFNCACLTSVTIPDSVTSIDYEAFLNCTSLTSVTIPDSVNSIGGGAFAGCTTLASVLFTGDPPSYLASSAFAVTPATLYYLPAFAFNWPATFGGRPTAVWPPPPVTVNVTFDAQGGYVSPASKSVTVNEAYGVLPVPARAGYVFGGWWIGAGGAGTQISAATVVTGTEVHTLYAKWTTEPPPPYYICEPGGVELSSSGAYDGYFYGLRAFNGAALPAVQGTLSLKVSNVAGKLTAKVVLQTGSLSLKASAWGSTEADGTRRVTLPGRKGEMLQLAVRQGRMWGTLSGGTVGETLTLDGARNRFADSKDAEAKTLLDGYRGYYTVALPVAEGVSLGAAQAAPQGSGYLTVTVGNGGSAKVAGVLADGTKVSHSSRLALFDGCGPEACVPLFAPLYSKRGWVGALLWLRSDAARAVATDRDLGWLVRWEKPGAGPDGFAMLLEACGGYYGTVPSLAAHYLFGAEVGAVPYPYTGGSAGFVAGALPEDIGVTVAGTRMTLAKGVKPTQTEGGAYDYSGVNSALTSLSFTSRTGLFKGKFSLYYDYELNGRLTHKAVSVPYAGVLTPVRGAAFAAGPEGQGHCLVPDNAPDVRTFRIKRSFPVWLRD